MQSMERITEAMIEYYKGDRKRINHFLKVHSFAETIGRLEKLDESTQEILEIAAYVHDIGIKEAEKRYHSSAGKYQEELGPAIAKELLGRFNLNEAVIQRVCYLVGHHHTYHDITGMDYQILVEADFLVNIDEDQLKKDAVRKAYERIFKTTAGKQIFECLYTEAFTE